MKFSQFLGAKIWFSGAKTQKHGAKTGAKTVKFSLFLHLPGSTKSPKGANDWGFKGRTFGGSKGERLGTQRANDWGLKKKSKIKLRIDSEPKLRISNSIRRSRCPGSGASKAALTKHDY